MIVLYRVVDMLEQADLQATHQFRPSPNGTEYKGFFFSQQSAGKFALLESIIRGHEMIIALGLTSEQLIAASPQHKAGDEGPGVLIRNEDLWQVQPHESVP